MEHSRYPSTRPRNGWKVTEVIQPQRVAIHANPTNVASNPTFDIV